MKKTLATLLEYLPCVRHSPEDLTCKPYHFAGDEIETQRIMLFGPAMQLEEKDLIDWCAPCPWEPTAALEGSWLVPQGEQGTESLLLLLSGRLV